MKKLNIFLMIIILCAAVGCASDDDNVDSPLSADSDETEMTTDNETSEPDAVLDDVMEADADEEEDIGLCKVGDKLMPGDSCIDPGTGDTFSVLEDGWGRYLFFNVGQSINIHGNVNGKQRSFVAERIEGDTWEIKEVTPE